jgi:hypothetical protein
MTNHSPAAQLLRVVFLGIVMLLHTARGMTVAPPTFSELVNQAGDVVRVEVSDIRCEWDSAAGRRVIHTYATCKIAKTLKGSPADSITLRFLGGRIGTTEMAVPDMPKLVVGAEYYLFVRGDGRETAFCPLVAVMHGAYRVQRDGESGQESVARLDGLPLRSLQDVALANGAGARSVLSAGPPMSASVFEEAIVRELIHGRAR